MALEELNKLRKLAPTKQAAFAYLTCERLYPNYVYFSKSYNYGNPSEIREAIDYLYDHLFESNVDKVIIKSLIKQVEKNTPDTEDFSTIFVSSALDVCTAVGDSLDFFIDNDFSRIENISTYALDTVSMYIQEIEKLDFNKDKDFLKKIEKHPLMTREVSIQSGIINFLSNSKSLDFGDIQTLLHLQENNKRSNLNL